MSTVKRRHNVHCHGAGPATIVFVHGYGCDQQMWRFLYPDFVARYRVILLDLVGCGASDLAAYDRQKYATLHGHAADMLEVIDQFAMAPVVFVGHSVSAIIGMLASIAAPEKFLAQVMVGPSPCYINDDDYVGGFNAEDIDSLLQMMEIDYKAWIRRMAPAIMGAPHPVLTRELLTRFEHNDPEITRHFARVTFTADHRADLSRSTVPALILQCSDDMIAPREVGEYMHHHMANSQLATITNIGHCPHMSAPSASADIIHNYLGQFRKAA
jgi:sigma-B regulation protein RsbQ